MRFRWPYRSIIIKFVRYNCRRSIFLNKKKIKNTGISITESLTAKRMEILSKAKERFGFTNVWTLDGQIHYLAEGSTKPQIFRTWTEVACFELWKKFVPWIPFLCFYFYCLFFLGEIIFVNNFSQVYYFAFIQRYCYFNILFWFDLIIFSLEPISPYFYYFLCF